METDSIYNQKGLTEEKKAGDSSRFPLAPLPPSRAKTAGPSLNSTVSEASTAPLLLTSDGSDETQFFGAGSITFSIKGDSPPKKACINKSARGAKRL